MHSVDAAGLDGLLDGLGSAVTCPAVCQVAMFLSTAVDLPNTGDSARIAKSALACCREILCAKFRTEEGCQWISSGDSTWKADLSSDLDQVEVPRTRRPRRTRLRDRGGPRSRLRGGGHLAQRLHPDGAPARPRLRYLKRRL